MSICLKLRNPISLVKSHFLKPITTFNSFRVPISGLFTQSKRFNPDKVSHKHLKFLLVLPNGPNGRKLTLAPSSFYLGVRAMLAAKGGRKHFLISSKGSVLFAPTTLCWGQKLGVAQGRWGGGAGSTNLLLSLEEYFCSWFSFRSVYSVPWFSFNTPILRAQTEGRSVPPLSEYGPQKYSVLTCRGWYTTVAPGPTTNNSRLGQVLVIFFFPCI